MMKYVAMRQMSFTMRITADAAWIQIDIGTYSLGLSSPWSTPCGVNHALLGTPAGGIALYARADTGSLQSR